MSTRIYFSVFLFIILLNSILVGQTRNYTLDGESGKIESEITQIIIEPIPTKIYDGNQGAALAAAVGTVVPFMIDLGTNIITQDLSRKLKKYAGEFTLKTSEQGFYKRKGIANLPRIKIIRKIKLKGESSYVDACRIILSPELAKDNSAFRYKLDTISYSWSKARTKNNFDHIDVNIAINLNYIHFDGIKYEIRSLRNVTLDIPQINLDSRVYDLDTGSSDWFIRRTEWIPFPAAPKVRIPGKTYTSTKRVNTGLTNDDKVTKTTKVEETQETKKEEYSFTSIYDNSVLYEILVTVREINPYKFRAEEELEYFKGLPFDDDATMLGAIVKLLFEKESEEENNE